MAVSRKWLKPLKHVSNQGKGQAILTGFRHADGKVVIMNDVDLQYPPNDMLHCYYEMRNFPSSLVIGSRMHPFSMFNIRSKQIKYIFTRHIFSRVLNFFVGCFLLPGIQDTQCGLKGFPKNLIEIVNDGKAVIRGFAFDIELLLIAKVNGFQIREMPVNFNYTDIPSSVRFLSTGTEVLRDLARISMRFLSGRYRAV